MGTLLPGDLRLELYYGPVSPAGEIVDAHTTAMELESKESDNIYIYRGHVGAEGRSGLQGFSVRALPFHDCLTTPYLPGLITWADGTER